MPQPALLELIDVSYETGGNRILNDVSWRIDAGDHWALLGRNGAGKTTLLKIACGYLWPNAGGRVLRGGVELTDLKQLRRSIGWVTSSLCADIPRQERALETVVSGRYACLGLRRLCHQQATDQDFQDALAVMRLVAIDQLAQRPFGVLSQGEQQKTLLARAWMAEPMLVILDEPCAGLDPASREMFLAAVSQLARNSTATGLVLVTHHLEEILPLFAQTLVLEHGRVSDAGPTRPLLEGPLLQRLYGDSLQRVVWSNGRCWPVGSAAPEPRCPSPVKFTLPPGGLTILWLTWEAGEGIGIQKCYGRFLVPAARGRPQP